MDDRQLLAAEEDVADVDVRPFTEAAQRELSAQARELRERTDLLAQSMAEAFNTP